MKTLFLMRHAKAELALPEMSDLNRPLLEKGKKRTKHIIDYLLKKHVEIDLIISSHAVRSRETARIMAYGLHVDESKIWEDKTVYTADTEKLLDLFYDLPAGVNQLMIVGHNPTITNFANLYLAEKIDAVPTSGIVCLEFDTDDWTQLDSCKGSMKFMIFPKMLK